MSSMADLPDRPRKIIHIDMDAFYASGPWRGNNGGWVCPTASRHRLGRRR